jgi:hypothetical protein
VEDDKKIEDDYYAQARLQVDDISSIDKIGNRCDGEQRDDEKKRQEIGDVEKGSLFSGQFFGIEHQQ